MVSGFTAKVKSSTSGGTFGARVPKRGLVAALRSFQRCFGPQIQAHPDASFLFVPEKGRQCPAVSTQSWVPSSPFPLKGSPAATPDIENMTGGSALPSSWPRALGPHYPRPIAPQSKSQPGHRFHGPSDLPQFLWGNNSNTDALNTT